MSCSDISGHRCCRNITLGGSRCDGRAPRWSQDLLGRWRLRQPLTGFKDVSDYRPYRYDIVYFSLELARRSAGSGVTVNAVDPGPVASNIAANNPGLLYSLAKPMIRHLFPSAARAARTCLGVATDPALETASGGYWRSGKRRARPLARPDAALSEGLWRASVQLTGADFPS